jgi:hypothetical protein
MAELQLALFTKNRLDLPHSPWFADLWYKEVNPQICYLFIPGFLNHIDILHLIIPCLGKRGYLLPNRMCRSFPGLYPVNARRTPPTQF